MNASVSSAPVSRATVCTLHPGAASVSSCADCACAMCADCVVEQPDGTALCRTCAMRREALRRNAVDPRLKSGQTCLRHRDVPAVRLCPLCGQPFCATCDFEFAGNVHVCPDCATKEERPLSPTRSAMAVASLVLAACATLGLLVVLSGGLSLVVGHRGNRSIASVVFLFSWGLSLVGMTLGIGALNRRLGNTPLVWIAAVWNTAWVVVCFLLRLL